MDELEGSLLGNLLFFFSELVVELALKNAAEEGTSLPNALKVFRPNCKTLSYLDWRPIAHSHKVILANLNVAVLEEGVVFLIQNLFL